ncbi:MAG TPA: ElyC/SanA/YdcF family protein, partial [Bacteroidales bacterium]|nr:ElyC/SanA/YdcF family protein [Bacteroidales bacterium]
YFKNGNFLLITSAIHMRRALGCFKKQDINVMPYSTDKITGKRRWDILYLISPNIQAIVKWQNLIHEVIGYYIYRLMGYI